jgi:diguanylate cyclase
MKCFFSNGKAPENIYMKYAVERFRRREIVAASIVFVMIEIISSLGIFKLFRISMRDRQAQVLNLAVIHGEEMRQMMEHTLLLDYTLEELVQSGGGKIADFPEVASRLLAYYPAASNLQLAPGGVVTQIVPLNEHAGTIGYDLLKTEKGVAEILAASGSGKLVLEGPYSLIQDGRGFIGRLPVFLKIKNHTDEFWGFVNVMIDLSRLLNMLQLSELQRQGYAYELSEMTAGMEAKIVIASSSGKKMAFPVKWDFTIANTKWTFSLEPLAGWLNVFHIVLVSLLCLMLDFFATAAFLFMLQLRRSNRKLKQLACIDQLTGLYTKQTALFVFDQEIRYAAREGLCVAVCFIDMNNFKYINDEYGHAAGDNVLMKTASRMRACAGPEDIVARYGGDEFFIVFHDRKRIDDYDEAIKKISSSLQFTADIGSSRSVLISAAVGAAVYPKNGKSIEELVQYADNAMYDAKRQNREKQMN